MSNNWKVQHASHTHTCNYAECCSIIIKMQLTNTFRKVKTWISSFFNVDRFLFHFYLSIFFFPSHSYDRRSGNRVTLPNLSQLSCDALSMSKCGDDNALTTCNEQVEHNEHPLWNKTSTNRCFLTPLNGLSLFRSWSASYGSYLCKFTTPNNTSPNDKWQCGM